MSQTGSRTTLEWSPSTWLRVLGMSYVPLAQWEWRAWLLLVWEADRDRARRGLGPRCALMQDRKIASAFLPRTHTCVWAKARSSLRQLAKQRGSHCEEDMRPLSCRSSGDVIGLARSSPLIPPGEQGSAFVS